MLSIPFSFFSCCIAFFFSCCILTTPSTCSSVSCFCWNRPPHPLPTCCIFTSSRKVVELLPSQISSELLHCPLGEFWKLFHWVRRVDMQSSWNCVIPNALSFLFCCSRITMVWRSRPTLSLFYCHNITCLGLRFNSCCVSDGRSIADPTLTSSREHNCCSVCHMTLKHASSSWFQWRIIHQPTMDQF